MRILLLFLSVMLAAVSASAQSLCDPAWLAGASGAAVQAQIRAGADVDQTCNRNGNRPLHQAILTAAVGPDVFRALVGAGADTRARNIDGATPVDYAVSRWQRASGAFREGSDAYRRELAIYGTLVRGGEAEYGAANDAQNQLCDPGWWRSSANASSVRALLGRPGVDPEARCNQNNDRPLHLALRWETFPNLPAGVKDAVLALAGSGASLGARNNTGRSPLALAEIRYDRYLARAARTRPAWCQGGGADSDVELYLGVRSMATGAGRESLLAGMRRDLCGGAGGDVPRQVGQVFRECDACPEMVVMPGARLALGRFEVTVGEYGAFASAAGGGCYVAGSSGWAADASASWRNPGFSQTNRHPVVCVSWNDAQQYVSWLSRTTGATYRLPTEGEWGSAAGGSGSGCSVNGGDAQMMAYLRQSTGADWQWSDGRGPSCAGSDGALFTASVGSYGSNGVGLSDMAGNVWEWTEGCWNGDCGRRVIRGGSWGAAAASVGPGARGSGRAGDRSDSRGFRVARTLD